MEPYHFGALVMGVGLGVFLLLAMIIGLYISARRSPGEQGRPE